MAKKTKEEQRVVGKQVLDTLTTGMYADNRIIFREYIQNAADAIDQAVATEILSSRDDGEIKITIDNEKREIKIRDNGIGIPTKEVYHGLGNIGKSQKIHTENRGFRGIGRLGGLAYCQELQFITSYKGDDCKTIMVWDSNELKRYLQPNEGLDMSLIDVVDAVTILDKQSEKADEHYFEVILTGITEGHNNLLDIDDVKAYLSQVAPIPFNCQKLSALKKVNEKLVELGKEPEEFNIYLCNDKGDKEQIYKPYQLRVPVNDKGKEEDKTDLVKDIEFFDGYKDDVFLFFLGWYGIRDKLNVMIKDDKVNGLRVRKGNIQIGDNRTLDSFFGKESYRRFNRHFVGEIYVFDDNLLPNGRRDDFEQNETYFEFKENVEKTTKDILAKLPYKYSKERSNEKRITESTEEIKEIKQEIASGVTDARKEQLLDKKNDIEKKIKGITTPTKAKARSAISVEKAEVTKPVVSTKPNTQFNGSVKETTGTKKTTIIIEEPLPKVENIQETKNILLEQLQELETDIQTTKNRPTDEIPSMQRKCKKILDTVFEVIDKELPEDLAKELRKHINEELQPKGRKKR
ncbi:ATP-binding protein [Candidatus Parabeggiatoa sp. HSG14]|uniref:ATP-binding protein n=1 Tax=Candidatus Parabeggiatoa sp. HSG14 TaxID=3055593 RepID=UPI0025A82866|nr:ATP-binding protein [Thiotrichales bacterium HSG14]